MMAAARPGVTSYDTPTDTTVVITRVVDAPRHIVFDAWSNPKHVPNWLVGMPGWSMTVCDMATKPGQPWKLTWRKADDGTEMTLTGVCREFTPPSRIAQTESWGKDWPETLNVVEFAEQDGRTTITLTLNYASKANRDAALATGMKDGMEISFKHLDQVLESLV